MDEHLSGAYKQYSERLPTEEDLDSEVEIADFYPEMKAALYRCSLGDEEKVRVFAEKRED